MSANHLPKKQKSNMNVLSKGKPKDEKLRATSPSDKSEKEDKVPMTADKKRGDDQKILRDSQDVSIMVGSQSIEQPGKVQGKGDGKEVSGRKSKNSVNKIESGLGRDSAFTLLAESVAEKQRISHFRGLSTDNPEAMMRGKFGKPLKKRSE